MKPVEATTPEELIDALLKTDQEIDWVPRKLLIQAIGAEQAQRFLPALPNNIAVNVAELLLVYKAFHPQQLDQSFQRTDNGQK